MTGLSEKDFQQRVLDLAKLRGWLSYHPAPTPAKWGPGTVWMTAGSDGFPDLVLAHSKHGVLFVELKTDKGRLSDRQVTWLHTLSEGGAEAHVWRPSDWLRIQQRLEGVR